MNTVASLPANVIEQGWRDTFSTNNPFCPCDLKSFTKAVRWAERALASPAPSAGVGAIKRYRLAEFEGAMHEDATGGWVTYPDHIAALQHPAPPSAGVVDDVLVERARKCIVMLRQHLALFAQDDIAQSLFAEADTVTAALSGVSAPVGVDELIRVLEYKARDWAQTGSDPGLHAIGYERGQKDVFRAVARELRAAFAPFTNTHKSEE